MSVSISAFLQAKIHEAFSVAADRLAQRGDVSLDERIELSSVIGDLLEGFGDQIDPGVAGRDVEVGIALEQIDLPDQVEDLPDPEEVGQQFMKTEPIFAVQMDQPFTVVTLEGEVTGDPGDWLAKNPTTGELWPLNDEVLDATYEPVLEFVESYQTERIVQGGGSCGKSQWALLSKTGKTLGCHDTKGDAEDQETAIQISKGSSVMRTGTAKSEQEFDAFGEPLSPDDRVSEVGIPPDRRREGTVVLTTPSEVGVEWDDGESDSFNVGEDGMVSEIQKIESRRRNMRGNDGHRFEQVAILQDFPAPALDLAEELAGQGKTRDEIRAALITRGFNLDADDIDGILDLVGVLESAKRESAMTGKGLVDLVVAGVPLKKIENFFDPSGPRGMQSVRLEPPSDISRQTSMSVLQRAGPRDLRTTAVERWSATSSASDQDLIQAIESLGFKVLPARPPIRVKAPIRIDDKSLRSFLLDAIPWLTDIQLIVLDHKRHHNFQGEGSMGKRARDLITAVMQGKNATAVVQAAFEQEVDLTGQKPDDPEAQAEKIAAMATELLKGGNGLADVTTQVLDEFPEVDNDTVKAGIQVAVDGITDEAMDVIDDDPGREEGRKRQKGRRKESKKSRSRRDSRRASRK